MYLKHFKLHDFPFSLAPNTGFYCDLSVHQQVLNVLLVSLRSSEGFIKVTGEVGSGKTLMCRKLLTALGDEFVTAYIPNPNLSPLGLHRAIAYELGAQFQQDADEYQLLESISQRLLHLHAQGSKVVLIIDEAQVLSDQCLEAMRLLTNLETESNKLLQVVLFGQPELNSRLRANHLRQLRQRIIFACELQPIAQADLDSYLAYRLGAAGYNYGALFTQGACRLLYKKSGGLPRVINILCHKAMLVAYGRGQAKVDKLCVQRAIRDTESVYGSRYRYSRYVGIVVISIALLVGVGFWYQANKSALSWPQMLVLHHDKKVTT